MGTWVKWTTTKVSSSSKLISDVNKVCKEHYRPDDDAEIETKIIIEKIKGLSNVIESNGEFNNSQIELIDQIIGNATLEKDIKA